VDARGGDYGKATQHVARGRAVQRGATIIIESFVFCLLAEFGLK
jgi:hypothetical protein